MITEDIVLTSIISISPHVHNAVRAGGVTARIRNSHSVLETEERVIGEETEGEEM